MPSELTLNLFIGPGTLVVPAPPPVMEAVRSVSVHSAAFGKSGFEITPTEADLTLLVWGSRRVLPVRVSGLTIVEEAFDPALRPIRAKVTIECKALSTSDLPQAHLGTALYLAYREAAERFAASVTTTMVRPLGVARLP